MLRVSGFTSARTDMHDVNSVRSRKVPWLRKQPVRGWLACSVGVLWGPGEVQGLLQGVLAQAPGEAPLPDRPALHPPEIFKKPEEPAICMVIFSVTV